MTINVRIRDGLCPNPATEEGGATEGDIRGSFSDIIDVIGVKDLVSGHCLVTQNSPAAMSVLVAPGVVYIPNADYDELDSNQVKFWEAVITVSTAVIITANTSGSARVDLICAKMDTAVTPDEHASNIVTLVAVAGTPGAGVPATPDNYAKLAEIAVANGAATIITANITDSRVQSDFNENYVTKSKGITLTEITTPDTPAANKVKLYAKDKAGVSTLYYLKDDGTEIELADTSTLPTTRLLSKVKTAVRDLTAASGDVIYVGVGFMPTAIQYMSFGGAGIQMGYFGSDKLGSSISSLGGAFTYNGANPFIIYVDGGNYQLATLKSFNADGFTLTWTKSGSPTGNASINFLCFR